MNQNRYEGQTSDDDMLVQRGIGHDAEAFRRLYDVHVDRVYGYIEIA